MTLNLTGDELEVIRTALAEYASSLREKAHPHCANYSPIGIDLCRNRLKVEALLDRLTKPQPAPAMMFPRVAAGLSFVSEVPKQPA